jgi:Na+/melibiose symporter-like transporter
VPRSLIAALAAPGIPLAALSLPLVVYLPSFYSDQLGLGLASVGSVFLAVRLIDILFDPFIGGIMDGLETRLGRYRPWLLLSAPLIMLSMSMLFMARPGVGVLYLTGWLLVAYGGWSVMSLAQLALAANASPSYYERSRVYGGCQLAFFVGLIAVLLLPKLLTFIGTGGPFASMTIMAWLVIVLTPLTVLITCLVVRERPVTTRHPGNGLRDYFDLMRNRTALRLIACEGMFGLALGVTSSLALFFFTRVKGLALENMGILLVGYAVVGLASIPVWSRLANRIGKHRALGLSGLCYATAQGLYLVTPAAHFIALAAVQAFAGISYGAILLLPRAMIADVSDQERLRTGQERTGLLFALLIGVGKIGQALSVGLTFYGLQLLGFSASASGHNSPGALLGMQLLYVGLPAVLSLAAAALAFRYPLTAALHAQIRQELEALEVPDFVHASPSCA